MFDTIYYRRGTSGNSLNDTEVPESNITRTYVEFYVAPLEFYKFGRTRFHMRY